MHSNAGTIHFLILEKTKNADEVGLSMAETWDIGSDIAIKWPFLLIFYRSKRAKKWHKSNVYKYTFFWRATKQSFVKIFSKNFTKLL